MPPGEAFGVRDTRLAATQLAATQLAATQLAATQLAALSPLFSRGERALPKEFQLTSTDKIVDNVKYLGSRTQGPEP
jgi:hypothetical protein